MKKKHAVQQTYLALYQLANVIKIAMIAMISNIMIMNINMTVNYFIANIISILSNF